MEQYYTILQACPLFKGINQSDIQSILGCLNACVKKYSKNQPIWTAGDKIYQVGIVLSGSVSVESEDYWGNRTIISKLSPGDLFGEAFSCAETEHLPINVISLNNTEIMFLEYNKIITGCPTTCTFHMSLIHNMIKILSQKNILLTNKMEYITKRKTKDKILAYLSSQAVHFSSNTFDIPFNRQELADFLSVDRSAMSNELCKLRDKGIIAFNKNHFTLIANPENIG